MSSKHVDGNDIKLLPPPSESDKIFSDLGFEYIGNNTWVKFSEPDLTWDGPEAPKDFRGELGRIGGGFRIIKTEEND